jgi:hypothetical protein
LDHGIGYGVVFTFAGMFHVIAFAVILATIPVIDPEDVERRLTYQGAG